MFEKTFDFLKQETLPKAASYARSDAVETSQEWMRPQGAGDSSQERRLCALKAIHDALRSSVDELRTVAMVKSNLGNKLGELAGAVSRWNDNQELMKQLVEVQEENYSRLTSPQQAVDELTQGSEMVAEGDENDQDRQPVWQNTLGYLQALYD